MTTERKYYLDIYALKPVKEVEPGWWKLRWRPLWKKTFSLYSLSWERGLGFLLHWGRSNGAHNGWNRSWDAVDFRLLTPFGAWNGWIKYNYIVHKDGPSDVPDADKAPLEIPS